MEHVNIMADTRLSGLLFWELSHVSGCCLMLLKHATWVSHCTYRNMLEHVNIMADSRLSRLPFWELVSSFWMLSDVVEACQVMPKLCQTILVTSYVRDNQLSQPLGPIRTCWNMVASWLKNVWAGSCFGSFSCFWMLSDVVETCHLGQPLHLSEHAAAC